MSGIEIIPSAKRLIRSLRDMGYDFSQAVADVVDNSIEARATTVAIDIEFDGSDSWVRIADNGRGMKPEQLREAMRFGADREYDADDLGKFGLGLKTASMSQCECLSVASRWNSSRADISAYAWDLNHIERTNRWEILPLDRNGLGPAIREPLKETTGTVVLWQRLDRLLGYKHPYGESSRKRLTQMCREVEVHLSMVFHRFLSGSVGRRKLELLLNGNPIKPWDPFCRSEQKTQELQRVVLPIETEGARGEVVIEPFVLPHQDDFSSPEAFRLASGPANWNQQQGFYIYRADRMIQSGGWSNLRAPDEHTKLARIAVSFAPAQDDAFKINVAKMRVQMPAQIRDAVREAMGPVTKLARETYDRRRKTAPSLLPTPAPSHSIPPSSQHSSGTPTEPAPTQPQARGRESSRETVRLSLEEWAERMLTVATDVERPFVEGALSRLQQAQSSDRTKLI